MRFINRTCWIALLVITGVTLAGFVTSNQGLISIHFWPASIILQAEIWVFILSAFGLGMFSGAGVFWLQSLSLKARLWSKAKQISELETRIEETEQQLDNKRLSSSYGQQASIVSAIK